MGTTRDFNESVRADLQNSAEYRRAFLREAVGCVVSGDVETGKSVLRKYINGTIGFVALGEAVGRSSKTLMQMLGPKGNPTITNFFHRSLPAEVGRLGLGSDRCTPSAPTQAAP